ncbi:hypothetical protein WAI453_011834 [Rhynchosporium graminicola]
MKIKESVSNNTPYVEICKYKYVGQQFSTIIPQVSPGAEIEGVQLSQLTANGLDQVALFAAQRGVLVFRKQDSADIGTIKQKEIVSHFGPLHLHPTMGYPRGTGPEFHVVYTDDRT